jgi:DNA-binding response OmpR family regulator
MAQILVIEDQEKLRTNLRQVLEQEGYQVAIAGTGEDGFSRAVTQSPDVILLDLGLPGRDGLEVLRDLRTAKVKTAVLVLTSRDTVEDRVAGLDAGADDYLVKPFAHAELLARVRALLRRNETVQTHLLRCCDVELDLLRRRVIRNGIEVELSQREFDLLEYLVRNKNSNVTRDMLARDVWKEPHGVMTNVIDVCVNSLRKKIELPGTQPLVVTIRGIGYVIRDAS